MKRQKSVNKVSNHLSLFSPSDSRNRSIRGRASGIDRSGVVILNNRFRNTDCSSSHPDHCACQHQRPLGPRKARDVRLKKSMPLSVAEKLYAVIENVEKNLSGQLEGSVAEPLISKLPSVPHPGGLPGRCSITSFPCSSLPPSNNAITKQCHYSSI